MNKASKDGLIKKGYSFYLDEKGQDDEMEWM